jgi:hypothetical protein
MQYKLDAFWKEQDPEGLLWTTKYTTFALDVIETGRTKA